MEFGPLAFEIFIPMRLFSTDLDGTLLGHPEGLARFSQRWATCETHHRPRLVYNTSRTVADTLSLVETRQLPQPDFILGSLGTEYHDATSTSDAGLREHFRLGWDLETVEEIVGAIPGLRRQPLPTLRFKSSWLWIRARRDEIDTLARRLHAAGLRVNLIYSARYFLDIVPQQAGKGRSLAWLCQRLRLPLDQVLVAGDSGHDADMFLLPETHGIVVENALPELHAVAINPRTYVARRPMAEGVIEGLEHFGVLRTEAAAQREAAVFH